MQEGRAKNATTLKIDSFSFFCTQKKRFHRSGIDGEVKNYYHHRR